MSRVRIPIVPCVLVLACCILSSGAFAAPIVETCRAFANYDQNRDGHAEIRSLQPFASGGQAGRRALVLVESRLLNPLPGAPDLLARLRRLVADLAKEGFSANA